MKELYRFIKNMPKSYRYYKKYSDMSFIEFHIWRYWKFYVKPKYKL